MDIDGYIASLESAGICFKKKEKLAAHTSYGVGGEAEVMAFPQNCEQIKAAAFLAEKFGVKSVVLGKGTNVLCSDGGFSGVVINVENANSVTVSGVSVIAECGASLSKVREFAELNCLGGLEFTEGIPASIGGAICMNAGCFSKSVGDKIAYVVTNKGVYNRAACEFDYRKSRFLESGEIVLKACFLLKPGETDIIESKKEKYRRMRKNSQPHGKSCGSVFQNDGYFAGKLIDTANLKGYRIGGARVSEKHANFIINDGDSAQDIYDLIKFIKERIFALNGVKLKEEIKYIGDFG